MDLSKYLKKSNNSSYSPNLLDTFKENNKDLFEQDRLKQEERNRQWDKMKSENDRNNEILRKKQALDKSVSSLPSRFMSPDEENQFKSNTDNFLKKKLERESVQGPPEPKKSANPYIRSGQDTEEERLKRLEEYNKNPIYNKTRKLLVDNPIVQKGIKPLTEGFIGGQADLIAKPISTLIGDKQGLENLKKFKKDSTENLDTVGKISNTVGNIGANMMYAPVINKIPGVGKGLDKLGSLTKSKYLNTALREGTENALFSGLTNASDLANGDMTVKDYAKNVALEGVGGAVFGTALKGIGEVGKKLNVNTNVNKMFDDLENPIKTIENSQYGGSPFKNSTKEGLSLVKKPMELSPLEQPIEKPGMNIKNPKGMNFYQTMQPKTETTIHQQPKVTIRKEKVNVDGGIGSIKIEERGNIVQEVGKDGKVKDVNNLSKTNVNALQYDFPELRPQIREIANTTLGDMSTVIKGTKSAYYDDVTGETITTGQQKFVEPIIQEIQSYVAGSNGVTKRGKPRSEKVPSYAKIEKALSDIVEDNGKENYALAKKVEHVLVKNLEYGQVRNDGVEIPPSLDFIENKNMLMEMDKGTKVNVNETVFKGNIETPITKTIPGERVPIKQPLNIEPLPEVKKPQSVAAFKDSPIYDRMEIGEDELNSLIGQGVDVQTPPRTSNKPPKTNSNGDLEGESRFKTITSMESGLVDKNTKDLLSKQDLTYDVKTDADMVSYADRIVKADVEKAYNSVMENTKPSAETTSIGVRLITELQKQGRFRETMDLINKMSLDATQSGQSIQKLSLIKKLSPEGMLYHLGKEIKKAADIVEINNPGKVTKADEVFEKLKQAMDTIDNEALDGLLSDFDNKIDDIINGVKSIDSEPMTPIKQGDNVEGGTTTKKKNKPGEKEVVLPEQKLANRVDNTLKEPKPKSQDIEKNMIDTLFNISKKTLPEKTKNAPTDPFTFVKFALERKNEYQQVFKEAKNILIEKYGKDSEEVSLLQDWIDQKARPIFFEKNMNTSIKNTLKDNGIKISDLVKQHYSMNTKVRTTLKDTLIAKGGLNEQDANTVSNYIEKYMKDATKEAKEKQLKTMFKERKTPLKKSDIQKIDELNNLGAFKNDNYKDLIYDKYGIPRLSEGDIKAISEGMEKYQGMADGREKDVQLAQIMKIVKDKIPSTLGEKIDSYRYINMLLNPRTLIKNVAGNMVNSAISVPRDFIATGIDKLVAKHTGVRTKGNPQFTEWIDGIKKGISYAYEDSKLGIDTTLGGMKEGSKGKALRNIPILGKLEKALSLGLSIGDRPFYEAAYQSSLKNAMKLNKVDAPTPQMIENAIQDGLEATYQQKTGLGDFISSAKNSKNKGISFVSKTILPFSQTPSSILDTALNYSPVGLVKGGLNLTKKGLANGGQRKGVNQLASGILGTGMIGTGYLGAKGGFIEGGQNEDFETAAIERQAGKQPYSLKIGDKYFNLDWAQPGASPLMTGADIRKNGIKKSGPTEIIKSGINSVMNNSFLSGANQIIDNISTDGYGSIPGKVLNSYASQMLPMSSMANTINKTFDKKARDTYDPNPAMQEVKKAMAKYPGLAQLLPQGIDSVGQGKLNNDGKGTGGRALNNMVTPWNSTEYNPSKAEKKALEIYNKTGETNQMPRLAPKYIEYKGTSGKKERIDLTQKERIELQTYIGQQTEKRLSSLNDPSKMQTLLTQISKEGQNKILAKRKLPQKK